MFNQNKNMIAHSGFVVNTESGIRQSYNAQILFNDWFWQGGFLILISYFVIAAGTCVFIRHLFSLVKEKNGTAKNNV